MPEAGTEAGPETGAPGGGARPSVLVGAGALIAFVCSMCGIGGGLFTVPLLHFGFGFALRRAVATSLALVLATVITATVVEALRDDSALRWDLLLALWPGALVGAGVGYRVAKRVSTRRLRAVFVVVLAAAGVRMLLGHGDGGAATDAADASGAAAIATAALIGFGGGFVSPLLGIGGGLVFVPALYLALPSLGFAGARACSLAASIVASARALRLYRAGREVSGAHAAFLAVGAVAGAVLGVTTVHLPGLAELGRHGLALVLLFVSGRFLRDAVRDRTGAADQA